MKNYLFILLLLFTSLLFSQVLTVETMTGENEFTIANINEITFNNNSLVVTYNMEDNLFPISDIVELGFGEETSIDSQMIAQLIDIRLKQNYPNPFNPKTNISFTIERSGYVKLEVFDIKGRLINTLITKSLNIGDHTVTWNGKDESNNSVSSGVYFYKLTQADQAQTRKMLLLK